MPLNIRSIATSVAVLGFFVLAMIGWFSGLTPFTCCKRSLIGALLAYAATTVAIRIINAILINAIVSSQITQKEKNSDSRS